MNASKYTRLALLAILATGIVPRAAYAHGLFGHVNVTGFAIENLPEGELREFFKDPEVFQAAMMGAAFPDTGYALDDPDAREYAEYAHWEPFINRFIDHVRETYGPTYTKEERLVVAFLLGCASHGLQDELFDSTFMFEAEQRDAHSQDLLDPGTDGFLVQDGYVRHLPGDFIPFDDILPLFGVLPANVTRSLIEFHVTIVKGGYLNRESGFRFASGYADEYRPMLPWASTHYFDASVPGSLRAEVLPTGRHMQALWDRLHDRFDEQDLVVHTWPDDPRRLREADHTSAASWVTFVLGKGLEQDSATGSITDADGNAHPVELSYTRWGGTSRIVRFRPAADFVPGGRYTVTLDAGAKLVDGSTTTVSYSHEIQVACATQDDPACPPLAEIPDPSVTSPLLLPSSGGCSVDTSNGSGSFMCVCALLAGLLARRRRRV